MKDKEKLYQRKKELEKEYKELQRQFKEKDYDWTISESDYIEVFFPRIENEYRIIISQIEENDRNE